MPPSKSHLAAGEFYDPTSGGVANLTAAWAKAWRAAPDTPQLHDPSRGWISRGELESRSAIRAGRLARLGLSPGERVLLSAESSADLVTSYIACLRLGLVVIPTNTAYGPRELGQLIADARPRAAILDDPERAKAVQAIDERVERLTPALELPDGPPPRLDESRPESVEDLKDGRPHERRVIWRSMR